MDPLGQLAVATLAFLATHFVSSTPLRGAIAGAIGEKAWLGLYTLVAFATIGWMAWAYGKAPLQPLWPGLRLLPLAVMPIALALLFGGLMTRNPTAVMQERAMRSAEPARGMIRVTRHPVMWAILLWAAAHVLARGDLASLVFFGGFLFVAALGTVLIDARKRAALGEDWRRFAAVTSNVPFGAIAAGRNRFVAGEIGWRVLVVAAVAYVVLLAVHGALFGARPY
ncbi:MAG TPA: NnrU family protein [Burkholderiales bacterium]|nr:NnrU family protein [Burkholderiales bacterium]